MNDIKIFTDGSVTRNGYPDSYGAFGYVILLNNVLIKEYSEYKEFGITNNQMELSGITYSLKYLIDNDLINNHITLYSDSKYCLDTINYKLDGYKKNSWMRGKNKDEQIPNSNYFKHILQLINQFNPKYIKFEWVKAHQKGNTILSEWNEYVDILCTQEIEKHGGVSFETMRYGK